MQDFQKLNVALWFPKNLTLNCSLRPKKERERERRKKERKKENRKQNRQFNGEKSLNRKYAIRGPSQNGGLKKPAILVGKKPH